MKRIFLFIISVFLVSCNNNSRKVQSFKGKTMGTTYSVKIVVDESFDEKQADLLQKEIDSLLLDVNKQMSTYIKTSEISKFNQSRSTEWFPVSSDFAEVVSEALEICNKTEGYFDITVGPIVNLWGFGPEMTDLTIPSDKEIAEKMKLTGYKYLSVRKDPPAIKKQIPEIYIDLSSIAKGFGVDKVGLHLEKKMINNYLVEIGGEVRTKGKNFYNSNWVVGIQSPNATNGIEKVIMISNLSMATSGDYYNYFEKDGVRFSHTINPKTGRPITHKLASVTVIHKNCSTADALATAIDVLGPEKGFEFAKGLKLPAFFIVRYKDRFVEKMTDEFKKILKQNER